MRATTFIGAVSLGALSLAALCTACAGVERPPPAEAAELSVERTNEEGTRARFRLSGLRGPDRRLGEAEGRERLRVTVGDEPTALLGRYAVEGGALVFEPAFALSAGMTYEVRAPGAQAITHTPTRGEASVPRIVDLAPHGDTIPSNTLRLHLRFSEPMAGGRSLFERVRLEDEQGEAILGAFRTTERWSSDRRALTLVFHPGRIKRNIPFARGLDTILEPGERVRLVVEPLPDAEGETMAAAFTRTFLVEMPDAHGPELADVRVEAPEPGTLEPLLVRFGEAVDPEVAPAELVVHGASCTWAARDDDRAMACTPSDAWPEGPLSVEVGCGLEDYAGNTPIAPFDAPASARVSCRSRQIIL